VSEDITLWSRTLLITLVSNQEN